MLNLCVFSVFSVKYDCALSLFLFFPENNEYLLRCFGQVTVTSVLYRDASKTMNISLLFRLGYINYCAKEMHQQAWILAPLFRLGNSKYCVFFYTNYSVTMNICSAFQVRLHTVNIVLQSASEHNRYLLCFFGYMKVALDPNLIKFIYHNLFITKLS